MPTVEGLVVTYSLYPLPPGKLPFWRYRWEIWHGARLIAAGWRTSRSAAERAVQVFGAEYGHELVGLRPPPRDPRVPVEPLPPGVARRLQVGPVSLQLVPRALETA